MDTLKTKWLRVSRSTPCPVCESDSWCGVSTDGQVARCMRVESQQVSEGSDGSKAWLHRLDEPIAVQPPRKKEAQRKTKPEIKRLAADAFAYGAAGREELAREWNIAPSALTALNVGYIENGNRSCWTFPCRDFNGQITGVSRRYRDGQKFYVRGSVPGLYYADDWNQHGKVYIVEGPSDVAALIHCGLGAIGRPSNTGGMKFLVPILKQAGIKQVTIFAENDHKLHDDLKAKVKEQHDPSCNGCQLCWPGKFGAAEAAKQLGRYKIRAVVRFPKAKDVRESVNLYGGEWI